MESTIVKCKKCVDGKVRREKCTVCKGSGRVSVTTDTNGRKIITPAVRA